MSRIYSHILCILFLTGIFAFKFMAWAEDSVTDGLIKRPVVEYKSAQLRDPFKTYFVKEELKPVVEEKTEEARPEIDRSRLKVQGIIWGVKVPQAIINDKVLTIGDLIEGAEIVSIEKTGVTLSFNGAIFDLAAPGIGSSKDKEVNKDTDKGKDKQ
ncbi:MAG: hypothetical protein PHS66_04150 [Candidatus Omnitrophica bacterium]|nr:hypothetical protein [Candidatus Omnitrophota bacterium]